MQLSARNQLRAKITAISLGNIMAEVQMSIGNQELVAAVTRESIQRLKLQVGDDVIAVVKATEVMVARP
ncbi:MAG TPA: TOBE domain-containing protein [bacterium]|nr:TOBE domain-containing protein [bacterium]